MDDVRKFIDDHLDYLYTRFKYLNDSLENKTSINISTMSNKKPIYRVYDMSGRYLITIGKEIDFKSILGKGVFVLVNSISPEDKRKIVIL